MLGVVHQVSLRESLVWRVVLGWYPLLTRRSQRHYTCDSRLRRPDERTDGSAEGLRRAGIRVLHEFGQPKRARVGWQLQSGSGLSLEELEPASAAARSG